MLTLQGYSSNREEVELETFRTNPQPSNTNLPPANAAPQATENDGSQSKTWKKTAQVAAGKANPKPQEGEKSKKTVKPSSPPIAIPQVAIPQVAIPRGGAPCYPIYFPSGSFRMGMLGAVDM